MKKYRSHILVFVFLGIFFFGGAHEVLAQEESNWLLKWAGSSILDTISSGLGILAYLVMQFMYWVTMFTGLILNAVVYHTVVKMAVYLENLQAIDVTWTLIRDVANMGFIFMLLYASIMTIIGKGGEYKGLIVKMIIAAILINFSLFFTKVIIDIANLLALTFYGAITPLAKLDEFWTGGIANGITEALGIQGFGSLAQPGATTALATMIMVTVTLLIASFVFLATAVMFLIRYVVLIITLILSPIMFLAGVFPQLSKVHKRWWSALFGQAFFAPVFFLLMWITLTLIQDISSGVFLGGSTGSLSGAINDFENTVGMVPLFINFAIIISFVVLSLVISKQVADGAGKESQNLTKWAMGKAGTATFGTAGFLGRQTVGRGAGVIANNQKLNSAAASGSMKARLGLWAARKGAGSSFDARAGTAFGAISKQSGVSFGKAGGDKGFTEYKKKKAEEAEKYVKSLAPGDEVVRRAEMELETAKETKDPEAIRVAQERLENLKGLKGKDLEKRKEELREKNEEIIKEKEIQKEIDEKNKEINDVNTDGGRRMELKSNTEKLEKLKEEQKKKADEERKKIEEMKVDSAADIRKKAYAEFIENKSKLASWLGYNIAAGAKIRKEKSKKDKFVESAKDFAEESGDSGGDKDTKEEKPSEESVPETQTEEKK